MNENVFLHRLCVFLHCLCVIHLTRSPTVLSETQRFLPERASIKISPPTFYYWNKFRAAGPLPNAKPSSLMRLSFPLSLWTDFVSQPLCWKLQHSLFRRFHLHLPGLNAFQALFRFCLNAACIFNCMQSRLHASLFPPCRHSWSKCRDMQSVSALSYSPVPKRR